MPPDDHSKMFCAAQAISHGVQAALRRPSAEVSTAAVEGATITAAAAVETSTLQLTTTQVRELGPPCFFTCSVHRRTRDLVVCAKEGL
eukprot:46706-Eustigmatos_ZCMA.PRE.2